MVDSAKPHNILADMGISLEQALPPLHDVELPEHDLVIKLLSTWFTVYHPLYVHRTQFASYHFS